PPCGAAGETRAAAAVPDPVDQCRRGLVRADGAGPAGGVVAVSRSAARQLARGGGHPGVHGAVRGRFPAAGAVRGDELSAAGDDARRAALDLRGAGGDEPLRGAARRRLQPRLALFVLAGMGTSGGDALFAALTLGTAEVSAFGSLSRVLLSLLAFAVLVSFPVLMVVAVRASVKNRRTDLPMPASLPTRPAQAAEGAPAAGSTSAASTT